jgi:hypothetical protein
MHLASVVKLWANAAGIGDGNFFWYNTRDEEREGWKDWVEVWLLIEDVLYVYVGRVLLYSRMVVGAFGT